MLTNKKLGNDFEIRFADLLFERGFWVHRLVQNDAGQPADIIAVKNNIAYLIDCKECKNNRFALSRIEVNQHIAMSLWGLCGNIEAWFALNTRDGIYMVHYHTLSEYEKASMNLAEIKTAGIPIGEWVLQ